MSKKITFFFILILSFNAILYAQIDDEEYYDNVPHFDTASVLVFNKRSVPDSVINNLKNDEDYWYANEVLQKKKKQQPGIRNSFLQQKWFQTLMWILIIISFTAVILWYLASSNISIFRRKAKTITGQEDEIDENIFDLDYEREIQKAISSSNYRVAVRLLFLQVLKKLSTNGMLDYRKERTNSDYLFQLSNTSYYKDFFRITRNFEYTWYGGFDLSAEAFEYMQKDFFEFNKSLKK